MRAALGAGVLLAALWGFTQIMQGLGAWALGLAALVTAVPLTLVGAHGAAMRRLRRLQVLDPGGWAFRRLSGPVLRVAVQLVVALVLALILLVRLAGQGLAEWAALGVAALAVPLGARAWDALAGGQIAEAFRTGARIRAGWVIGALAGLVAYLVLRGQVGAPVMPAGPYRSALVEQAVLLGAQWQLLEDFALGQLAVLGDWGRLAAGIVSALGVLALAWTGAGLAAAFLLTRAALARALAPVGAPTPGPVALGWTAALVTILLAFVYVPALALAEATLRGMPRQDRPSEVFVTQVEEIGGRYFAPGTIAEITGRRIEAQVEAAPGARALLHAEIDAGFDAMTANVDPFLDWYYSLPAEYAQIGHLLAGDFESYLAGRMADFLGRGAPFAGLEEALAGLETVDAALRPDLARELAGMAEARRVDVVPGQPLAVTGRAEAPVLLGLDGIGIAGAVGEGLKTRLAVSGGTAGVAGALTGAVVAKLGAKGVTKVAAKAAVKVAASKGIGGTAGAGAGAAAGGLLGSVVPGLGTAAGALIGGAIGGLAVGVGTDFLLKKLEEALSRETLRADIVAELDAARLDVHGLVDADLSAK